MTELTRKEKAVAVRKVILTEKEEVLTDMVDLLYEVNISKDANIFEKKKAGGIVVQQLTAMVGADELLKVLDKIIMEDIE